MMTIDEILPVNERALNSRLHQYKNKYGIDISEYTRGRYVLRDKLRNDIIDIYDKVKDNLDYSNNDVKLYLIPGETSDGAVMFIPAESIFAEIHAHFPDLVEEAQTSSSPEFLACATRCYDLSHWIEWFSKELKISENAG